MSAEPFSPDIPSEPSTFCTRRRRWVSSLGGAGCALLVLLNILRMLARVRSFSTWREAF